MYKQRMARCRMMLLANFKQLSFKQKVLPQAIVVLCALHMPAYALQALDDESMSDVTGEGIAFTVTDFKMQFNGADDAGAGNTGTGYFRFIPRGALSAEVQAYNTANPTKKIGKGDIYLYGASISANDNNVTTQFSGNTLDMGTSANPWLISVKTVNTPSFNGVSTPLTYMQLETPLFTNLTEIDGTLLATDPNLYNLKLGVWIDAFVRDPSKTEGDALQFALNSIDTAGNRYINGVNASGGLTLRENRLRLQQIINGVSLNGSSIKIFQTLDGANVAPGLGSNYSSYINTLGLAATVRMNSGDAGAVRAPVYSESMTDETTEDTGTATAWSNLHGGWDSTLSASQSSGDCSNGGSVTTAINSATGCQFMVQSRTRTDSKTRTVTKTSAWTTASGLDDHVIRFSTQEKGTTQGLLYSPAFDNGVMPTFADTDGLFLYKPNINLVIGSQWQPLVMGVAADNKNLTLEVTRIPNVASVYKEIYTDYTGADASYKGGTCSVYWCGGDGNGISKNATHSSITLGTTLYTAPVNTTGANKTPLSVSAYKGADAAGVSFGSLMAVQGQTQTNNRSNDTTVSLTQAQWIQRTMDNTETWLYRERCTGRFLGACTGTADNTGTISQWKYGTTLTAGKGNIIGFPDANYGSGSGATSDRFRYPTVSGTTYADSGDTTTAGLCPSGSDCTYYGTSNNRNWTFANYNTTYGLNFSTTTNGTLDSWLAAQGSAARSSTVDLNTTTNQAAIPVQPVVAQPAFNAVNLGSAAIDGLLIQHLKITTKGL